MARTLALVLGARQIGVGTIGIEDAIGPIRDQHALAERIEEVAAEVDPADDGRRSG